MTERFIPLVEISVSAIGLISQLDFIDVGDSLLTLEGVYVNNYLVTYSQNEFYVQLQQDRPPPEGRVAVGVFFMRPEHAKGLAEALRSMVDAYEKQYREVEALKLEEIGPEHEKPKWKGIT